MIKQHTYRKLIWVIVILVAMNLSMGISFFWHKQNEKTAEIPAEEETVEMPAQQRTRFFRDELNLDLEQVEKFREYNREYNRNAWEITYQLESLRVTMIEELGKEESDSGKLELIAKEIGEKHTGLKMLTIGYYLKMRDVCNNEQKERLNEIFMSVLKKNEDVKLPEGHGRNGRNTENRN